MIKTKHVWQEIVKPEEIEKSEDNKFIWVAMYKAMYMGLRILLDIRHNLLNAPNPAKKEGKKIVKFEVEKVQEKVGGNTVIKDSDNITIEEKKDKDNEEKVK